MYYTPLMLAALSIVKANPVPEGVTAAVAPLGRKPSNCHSSFGVKFGITVVRVDKNVTRRWQPSFESLVDKQNNVGLNANQKANPRIPIKGKRGLRKEEVLPTSATKGSKSRNSKPDATKTSPLIVTQINDGQVQAPKPPPTPRLPPVTQISDGQVQAPPAKVRVEERSVRQSGAQNFPELYESCWRDELACLYALASCRANHDLCTFGISPGDLDSKEFDGFRRDLVKHVTLDSGVLTSLRAIAVCAAQRSLCKGISDKIDKDVEAYDSVMSLVALTAGSKGLIDERNADEPGAARSCRVEGALEMELKGGRLTDAVRRTGYIADNHQLQFDNPPQSGAVFTAGWSVCDDGTLALGSWTTFFQYSLGDSYNLYILPHTSECEAVQLKVIFLDDC